MADRIWRRGESRLEGSASGAESSSASAGVGFRSCHSTETPQVLNFEDR